MYENKRTLENILILLLDMLSVAFSLLIAYLIRFGYIFGQDYRGDHRWLVIFAVALYGVIHIFVNQYDHFFRRSAFQEFLSVIRSEVIFSVCLVLLLYFMHQAEELSRLVWGYFIIINTVVMFSLRMIFKEYMVRVYKRGKSSNRLIIVTNSNDAETVLKNLEGYNEWDRVIVGIALTDDSDLRKVGDVDVVADRDSFMDYVVHNNIDEVFFIDETIMRTPLLDEWMNELEQMGVLIDINIDIFDFYDAGKKSLNRVGKYAVVAFTRNYFTLRQRLEKRILDICGSLIGMVILGIATIFVAPAIKLTSPGPVFFGQTRIGKNGRRFTFYKFRSMYQDAEERKAELMAENEVDGLMFKMEDDPRITKVGKFLRRTSIDELPQFWNVLKGDMSLVGTRPPTVDEFEQYEAKHKGRLSMTPGMTGLWQVSGRSDIKDFDEVVKLDMQYIDNWSLLRDIEILFKTVQVVITGKGSR